MGNSFVKFLDSIERINPFLRTDVCSKDDADFGMAMCSRFGKVRHLHAWHKDNYLDGSKWQTFEYEKLTDVAQAKSWLEVMEILEGK